MDPSHISDSQSLSDGNYLQAVDMNAGSFLFSPPPPYTAKHKKLDSNENSEDLLEEHDNRYVSDNAFEQVDDPGANDYEQAVDSFYKNDNAEDIVVGVSYFSVHFS